VRKQYHFWRGNAGLDAWDVHRLIGLSKDLPTEEIALHEIWELDSVYWFDENQLPTVRRAVEHIRLTAEVDPSYPIILGPDGRVMDGMHRVARALLEGREPIRAVHSPTLPTTRTGQPTSCHIDIDLPSATRQAGPGCSHP
jgi:hypothetical protein